MRQLDITVILVALVALAGIFAGWPQFVLALSQQDLVVQYLIAIPAIMVGAVLLVAALVLLAGESDRENGGAGRPNGSAL